MGTAECACNIVRIDHQMLGIDLLATGQHNRALQNIPEVSESAIEKLEGYAWPGNVRELENVLQRAIVLAGGQKIDAEHLMIDPYDVAGAFSGAHSAPLLHAVAS